MTKPFESSDDVRSAKPLRYAKTFRLKEPLTLVNGGCLKQVEIAYETYGELNEARDNALLICHALSGDSHVAQHDANDDPGWWDILVGPGRHIDTNEYFVICPNLLGSCRGTTGPGSINPDTGVRYGADFPIVTVADMVEVQRQLIDHLGIEQLAAVIGGSLGGHQAMTWGIRYPNRVKGIAALATSPRLTMQALAFDVVGRNAILRDPNFAGGQYYDKEQGPAVGLALARMIGHITYLSAEAMKSKFEPTRSAPRDVATEFEKKFSVGSYLGYQGTRFVERFDANSYVTLSLAMDLFDLGADEDALRRTFNSAKGRWLVLSFSSDWLFRPDQSQEIVRALIANKQCVSYCNIESSCGHDAFLLPNELPVYGAMIRSFLANLTTCESPSHSPEAELHGPTSIFQHRIDYDRIVDLTPPDASVLDLGCGSGGLLSRLRQKNPKRLVGVELDQNKILTSISRGLDVIQADLNRGLSAFGTGEFDCVLLSQTLQAVFDVENVIGEMLRIGRMCIVSIPNFAYAPLRKMLAEQGRAPKATGVLQHEWYNSPNVRFLSIADFEDFCVRKQIRIEKRVALDTQSGVEVFDDPNLNADLAIFVISRNGS